MIGALLVGLVAGVLGRVLMPRDVFRHMRVPLRGAFRSSSGLAEPCSAT